MPQTAAARRLQKVRTFGRWDCINARQRERAKGSRFRSLRVPSHVPSHPHTAAKVRGFSPIASGFTAETDWPLEGGGFEPSVPLRRTYSSKRFVRPFQQFPSERDRGFEAGSLQRGVTCEPELSVSGHHHSRHRVGIGDICLDRYGVSARRRNFRDGRFRLRLFVAPNRSAPPFPDTSGLAASKSATGSSSARSHNCYTILSSNRLLMTEAPCSHSTASRAYFRQCSK